MEQTTMIRAVLFDWGNTVMRNLPYAGPMADWPRVEMMPGVAEALSALAPHYRLVLATNAMESGPALVWAALQRVGLENSFDDIFTARQLGATKPDPAFFAAVLAELGCAPGEVAMVGDDYVTDVGGAKEVGLRAVWFNADSLPCFAAHPVHDAEVRAMADLPAVLGDLRMPDMEECLELLAEQHAPAGVLQHSKAVAAIAYRMATWLQRRGEALDPLLVHRGGLLHDLGKISSHQLQRTHGEVGAALLREKGLPELAEIVERHLIYRILDPATGPVTWEQKLVYYVDKVVEGDAVVSVRERIETLCGRYPEDAGRMCSCLPPILELEAEIRGSLGISSQSWLDTLRAARSAERQGARRGRWSGPSRW
jgi:putative hydrolase of the HAD superfamily